MSCQLITFNNVFSYYMMMLGGNCVMLAKVIEARREDGQMILFARTLALISLPNTLFLEYYLKQNYINDCKSIF